MSRAAAALGTQRAAAVTPYERFRFQLNQVRSDVAQFVGAQNVDKFVRVCLNAVQANPKVLQADRRSLLLSCLRAAQDGLLPDGREAVLNIFSTKEKVDGREAWVDKVQYMPMAYGLIQKIYDAGATFVDAVAVFEKDTFEYERGDNPRIAHKPWAGDDEPGKVIAAYCVVKLRTGETKREVMFRRDIETVRSKSKAKDGMMWKDFYDQGAIKSVIHRINKQLPRAEALALALDSDNIATGLADVPAEATGANLEQLLEHVTIDEGGGGGGTVGGGVTGAVTGGAAGQASGAAAGATTPPAAKPGDPGTPELKQRYLDLFAAAKERPVLDLKMDEVRFFKWGDGDLQDLTRAYEARAGELG